MADRLAGHVGGPSTMPESANPGVCAARRRRRQGHDVVKAGQRGADSARPRQDIDTGQMVEQALDYYARTRTATSGISAPTRGLRGGSFVNANDAWLAGVRMGHGGRRHDGQPQGGAAPVPPGQHPRPLRPLTAEVAKLGQSKCVTFRCFSKVLASSRPALSQVLRRPGVGAIATEPNYSAASAQAVTLDEHARTTAREYSPAPHGQALARGQVRTATTHGDVDSQPGAAASSR